jgi:ACS family allantoate permease-like MFS transporter
VWGTILCCFAAVENYSGAIAIRFFLGVFEAAVTPGWALFTSQWWTKKEQGSRTGIWFSFNGFAQVCLRSLRLKATPIIQNIRVLTYIY